MCLRLYANEIIGTMQFNYNNESQKIVGLLFSSLLLGRNAENDQISVIVKAGLSKTENE